MIRVDETDPVGEIEPPFPYRDVTVRRRVEFRDCYDIQSEIGRGKFGTVYRCKDKATGLSLAAKVVSTTKKEDRRAVEREVEIMRRLQHPRLIQLYDAIDTGRQIYVILELIEGGELFERVIDDDFVLTERSCAVFMRQICEGIEFIHGQKILHLDLKPENILCLTKEGNRIKIIDFGLARQYDPNKKLQVLFGTPEFVAPEVVNFDQIGFGTDMWSIGVICYVLLSGLSPFMGDTDIETMANVTIAKYDFDHEAFAEISDDAKDFIRGLLVKDKEKRATAAQCREHRWLARRTRNGPRLEKKLEGPEARARNVTEDRAGLSFGATPGHFREELDVTKDNLRLFVERWREHPNSPYTLDIPQHVLPKTCNNEESVRCHSPSPCESLASTPSEMPMGSPREARGFVLRVPSYTLALERRASEGTAMEKSRDAASQIVLAEEIIRLSEHLRSIAMSSKLGSSTSSIDEDSRATDEPTSVKGGLPSRVSRNGVRSTSNGRSFTLESSERNEITEKLSNITRQRKLNGTTFHSSRSFEKQDTRTGNLFTALKKRGSIDGRASTMRDDSFSIAERDSSSEDTFEASVKVSKEFLRVPEPNASRLAEPEMDLTPPWRRPRLKQFSEASRDVPRISNLRDLHKNLNLDEPGNAKDLLLHLLGEWEETVGPKSGLGRKSVSVDWCGEESVSRKSINSLAEYFQSKQEKSTSSGVPPAGPPSIHR